MKPQGYRCPGSGSGHPHGGKDKRQERHLRAVEHAEVRASRSAEQQIRELDRRLGGPGIGAKRERARLLKAIETGKASA